MSGRVAFGLRRVNGRLVPHPVESALVREVAEAFLRAGGRLKSAAADLNARGFRTREDAKWSDVAVGRVLKILSHEGVVAEELRERCLALLEERAAGRARLGRRPAHPLGGVVFCACSAAMHREDTGGAKFVCRKCRSKIRLAALEAAFAEGLGAVMLDPSEIVAAVADNPRAAELTRQLGVDPVPLSRVWPTLGPEHRHRLVELVVERVVVEQESVGILFAAETATGTESRDFSNDPLPSPDCSVGSPAGATDSGNATAVRIVRSRAELPLLLSVEQAAALLRTTPKAVYAMAGRAQLRGAVRVGRRLLVRRDELLHSLGESRAPSPKEVRR
jgi:hypothetical protein